MPEVSNNYIVSQNSPPAVYIPQEQSESMNLDAHYSKDMKVRRPNVSNNIQIAIPNQKLYNSRDVDKRFTNLSTDVFSSYQKEKKNNDFNFKTFFKIFCAIVLSAGILAIIRRFRK